jgi:hypothetical protein
MQSMERGFGLQTIKPDELRLHRSIRSKVHDGLFAAFSTRQPVEAPAPELHFVCQAGLDHVVRGGLSGSWALALRDTVRAGAPPPQCCPLDKIVGL